MFFIQNNIMSEPTVLDSCGRTYVSAKDLARTRQGLGTFTFFERAWVRFEGLGGVLEALRVILLML